ncbi:MAG: diguanylate cyclase, partial [Kangiellaceae bacterium]|nr:diguanylate cyclase [Kangiellaceae bacterium]
DHCDLKSAKSKVESIRKKVEELKPESLKVTASFGVAQLKPGEELDNLIKRADDALYEAKQTGRNKVVLG